MADVTVTQFAEVLKVPVDRLLQQLDQAGIKVAGAQDIISEDATLYSKDLGSSVGITLYPENPEEEGWKKLD